MNSKKVEHIRRHYSRRVDRSRPNYDILDWASEEAQVQRFAVLRDYLQQMPGSGARPLSLLDVGCGMTDLAGYCENQRLPVLYTGVDITVDVLAEARRRYPFRSVAVADVFSASPFAPAAFDVTYCSGVFNLQLGNNDAFVRRALPCLLAHAREAAVANFLHIRTRRQYPHCHYFDPQTIVAMAKAHNMSVTVCEDYLENDFTVVLRRG